MCLLKKSFYGETITSAMYERFDQFLLGHCFSRSEYRSCIYLNKVSNGYLLYLLLYVDDMLVVAKDTFKVHEVKEMLKGEFEMKDFGSKEDSQHKNNHTRS